MGPKVIMRCGLFGKLPAKRDFVTLFVPRSFLRVWEPWIEQGLQESRKQLGLGTWRQIFSSAPIWRFWLGEDLCGKAMIGAFMPSMDACGRLFPLTVVGLADAGEVLLPPIRDPLSPWFEGAEKFLLSMLDPNMSFEAIPSGLAALAAESRNSPVLPLDVNAQEHDCDRSLQSLFARVAKAHAEASISSATFWWTLGSERGEPLALKQNFMPPPLVFTGMLTLCFAPRAELRIGMTS